jgi:hypothetical protein
MEKEERPKNKPQMIDKAQSERFRKIARKLGCDEDEKTFEEAFTKIVPPRRVKRESPT